jgi:serine/threonine protein phosphatase 1
MMQEATLQAEKPVFNPSVTNYHERIDASAYEDVYIIGDVHGCIRELEDMLTRLSTDGDTLFVFVGDLVRKGPDSSAVISLVREHENMVAVRGNNEQKLIDDRAECPDLTDSDREYIGSLPVAMSWEDVLVVHGGINPRVPLVEHTMEDLLTMRLIAPDDEYEQPYWFNHHRESPRVFFGHTVLRDPFETKWAVGLDTGCVYGGRLTAYHYGHDEYVTVEAKRAYQFRADDGFLVPQPSLQDGPLAL